MYINIFITKYWWLVVTPIIIINFFIVAGKTIAIGKVLKLLE